ncbi:pyruvate, phosphate dikinase [Wolbachia pipientis]|uniref:Pyruvate, phosphate dikinase n=1 Tax=Wolbachia pipientis TaxID=955 RepID=A0A1E7QKU6_WOLPI|nr:pyruvate, phosphate dikinase [Wolbachia pipientis]OEY87098.1 pyruvate, phosphate dikinase [Wolbachia pipientis]
MGKKLIYYFSQSKCDGNAEMKNLLGSKGANLAEMCNIGIPVPSGFTLCTQVCKMYYNNDKLPDNLCGEIKNFMAILEEDAGCKFGDPNHPLLVSVRSGSIDSMPGMLDTILNVGLNDETVIGLAKKSNERFAYDSYCRFITMYSNVVLQLNHYLFQDILDSARCKNNVESLVDLDVSTLKQIINDFKNIVYENTGKHFPQNINEQLLSSITAVFSSWKNERAVSYRRIHNISEDLGTAVNIQTMVFGNLNNNSATGVIFTRNPSTGEKKCFGEFLLNAQGEDIVSGFYTPLPINNNTMGKLMPEVYEELYIICKKLEEYYKEMQDIEFTVQDGKLWILQTRSGKRTPEANIRIVVDMVNEKMITKNNGILKVDPNTLNSLLHPIFDIQCDKQVIGVGLPASPGIASGYVVFNTYNAEKAVKQGKQVILVRSETSPEDINGMNIASGIMTARGGMTSHAAVVTRGMGKPCICSVNGLHIDKNEGFFVLGEVKINKDDPITINGNTGEVILGILPTILPELSQEFETIMQWVDEIKTIKVLANADTPKDVEIAKKFGAEGIGLCRTEHMFFAHDRINLIQKLIIADSQDERVNALEELEKMQKSDFKEIFSMMVDKEITVRLLDPPLHEFLPNNKQSIKKVANLLGRSIEDIRSKVEQLSEQNPMLGHRGCRIAISYPEIYRMQIRAILSTVYDLRNEKNIVVKPEIMIPFVISEKELILICEMAREEARNFNNVQYSIGTMIELPRAALIADKLAKHAEFFSFGTNDLTQTTMGLSRDDSVSFLDTYKQAGIFENDPFVVLDVEGVGELMKIAVTKGRKSCPELKIGICGEHGADPKSIGFFINLGLQYVSCSAYRVPIAKLVAAHIALNQGHSKFSELTTN